MRRTTRALFVLGALSLALACKEERSVVLSTLLRWNDAPLLAEEECASDISWYRATRAGSLLYKAGSQPELAPLDNGKIVLVKQYELTDGTWSDEASNLFFAPQSGLPQSAWEEDGSSVRARRATLGDERRRDLIAETKKTKLRAEACIEQTCKGLREACSTAERLHQLHSSDASARELVGAETALRKCIGPVLPVDDDAPDDG
ncbi:MAG: hypothetical protein ABI895_29200 [Deltaproteobacteria bacterium]